MKNPTLEALKEVGRWIFLFVISWIITETLKQVVAVPEYLTFKVWVFMYAIPVRLVFQMALTTAGRLIDRWVHENPKIPFNGIMPKFLN